MRTIPCITTTATVPMARRSSATTTTSRARTVAAGATGAPRMPSPDPGSVRGDVAVTRLLAQRSSPGLRCSLWAPTHTTVGPDVPRSEASGELCARHLEEGQNRDRHECGADC